VGGLVRSVGAGAGAAGVVGAPLVARIGVCLRREAVQGVAALGEVGHGQHAERAEGTGQAAAAQLDGDGVDVGPGGHRVGRVHLPARQRRVTRQFAAGLDPLLVPLRAFPPGPGRLGSELLLQRGRLTGQLLDAQLRRRGGQDLIGPGGVGGGEGAGVHGDPAGPGLVDHSGRQAGEGHGEAGGQVDRIVDPVARVDS
jgi:hypothetical protein